MHKRNPKGDEQPKLETKRRTGKQKRLGSQEIIEQIINDGNLKNIYVFYIEFDEEDKKQLEEAISLYLDSFSKILIELEKILPKELYYILEIRKIHVQNLDRQIRETKLVNLCPSIIPQGCRINKRVKFNIIKPQTSNKQLNV